MVDPRIKKLAEILVNYSIVVKKGSLIKVNIGYEAKELGLEVYKLLLKKVRFLLLIAQFLVLRMNTIGLRRTIN